jgi:hypothetical protein
MGCGGSKPDVVVEEKPKEDPKNLHPREQPASRKLIAVHPPLETGQAKWVMTLMQDTPEWRKAGAPALHVKAGLTRFYLGGGRLEPFNTFPVSSRCNAPRTSRVK